MIASVLSFLDRRHYFLGAELHRVLQRTVASIGKYVFPYKWRLLFSVLLGMASATFNGLMLIGFQLIFSLVLKGQTRTMGEPVRLPLIGKLNLADMLGFEQDAPVGLVGVIIACSFIPILIFIRGFLSYLSIYMQAVIASKVVYKIRNDTFRSVMRQSPAFFSNARTGELMQTVVMQTTAVHQNAMLLIQTLAQRPLTIISILTVLFAQDWVFTSVALLIFPACVWPIMRIGKSARAVGQNEVSGSSDLMVVLQESFAGSRLVKSYAREEHQCELFEVTNANVVRNTLGWTRLLELVGPIVESVASIGIGAGLVYAWYRGLEAENFFLLVMALTQIYPPVKELSRVQMLMQRAGLAAELVFQLLEKVPDILDAPDAVDSGRARGAVEFRDVTFSYLESDGIKKEVPAVNSINLKLDPGKFYAFVGPSGAGKSTLYSLILRFYDPDKGSILLDGCDIRKLTQTSLRGNIGVVNQDTFLFHTTILENIRYGRLDASREEIIEAAKKAHAHEFIEQIGGGYDAVVGEGGCKLSGGQKQRLSIARAILRNAPILLLDEATSALDTESEKIIQDAIQVLSEGKTVVAIAHRLSTILEADQIVVMDHGYILDCGSHSELLVRNPMYQKLYHLQFSADEKIPEIA
jgi:subfamily B ATP-binding cassette protein MsbA|uniref:ABC transporter ATP-binding protein n=1 Tax=Prosthecobacter sp. TaxID=1965333 RepID=UPI00378495D1